MRTQSLAATVVLVTLALAPLALAQGTAKKPKKKHGKAAASASASVEVAPEPTPEPEPPPPPPPAETASTDAAATKELPATPPEKTWDSSDTREDPMKRYYFVGLRYRGDVIPKFLINAFVDGGASIYSNAVGLELDSRKDGFSQVFGLTFQNYGTGNLLFLQKGKDSGDAANWSVVNSGLSAIYASVDLLWSVPIDTAQHWDFEYGIGVGLGVLFGNLADNWVYNSGATGTYFDPTTNQHFNQCQTQNSDPNTGTNGSACMTGRHNGATIAKVGNYIEPAGIAGPRPILFPMVNFPQLGLRYKPIKQFEARVGVGFSLTGFWFGISGDYGLEKQDESEAPATKTVPTHEPRPGTNQDSSGMPSLRGML
jgi:hypothetical protein